MLQLTKRTEYGLIALTHLAHHPGEVISASAIAESYPVPRRLLAEVLKEMQRAGLVLSTRGANGGYALARAASAISVGEVVAHLEGEPALTSCEGMGAIFKEGGCEVESVCSIRSPLQHIRRGIWALLESTSLESLVNPNLKSNVLIGRP
jgi:Rrf2 family protein